MTVFAVSILGIYTGVVTWMWTNEDRLVYSPSHEVTHTPHEAELSYETVHIATGDSIQLTGWFIPYGASQKTVLFLHGNAGSIDCCIKHLKLYHDLGFAVLLIDYRGYGASTGQPTEAGLYEDAAAAWNYLLAERGVSPNQIVVVGQSLGGAVATWLVVQHKPAGLILDSPFTTLPGVAALQYCWLPVQILMSNRFASIKRIGVNTAPLLILHSRDDQLVPFNQAEQLYAAAASPKTLVPLRGPHVLGLDADSFTYRAAVQKFVDTLGLQ